MSDKKHPIILVEDDLELSSLIKNFLEGYEFEVEVINNGLNAVERVIQSNPELVILDLMLPFKDGITICKELRPKFDKGIIMLTASNESIDHILGLEIGADDYLNKPIEPRVLLAHLRALLRRQHATNVKNDHNILKLGCIEISKPDRLAKVNGNALDLTQQEYELLLLFMDNAGSILSRDEIFKALKGIEYDGVSRFSDILVSQLRTKLGEFGDGHLHIRTVRNRGYLFVKNVE